MSTAIIPPVTFSIITPTYNRPELLQRCVDSILQQQHTTWCLYIIDDCSSVPYTFLTEPAYQDSRIRYTRLTHNRGVNYARNLALEQICQQTGNDGLEYVMLLDDDDWLTDNSLEQAKQLVQTYPDTDWFISNVNYFGNDTPKDTLIRDTADCNYIRDYLLGKRIQGDKHHVIKRQSLASLRFTTYAKNGQEWWLFIRLSHRANCKAVDTVLKIVDYQPDGLTHTKSTKTLRQVGFQTLKPILAVYYQPNYLKAWSRSVQAIVKLPQRLIRLMAMTIW